MNLNGYTPLHLACKKGKEQFVEELLDFGAKIDIQTRIEKDNVFHVTAKLEKENTAIMHILFNKMYSEGKSLVNYPNKCRNYPLHLAFRKCHINYVKLLLQNGAEINASDRDGNSVLHYVVDKMFPQEMDLLNLLIENDANINLQNRKGQTPLHLAVKYNPWDKIESLLIFSAKFSYWLKQQDEVKPLADQWNKVQTLLDLGADINVIDVQGMTVLHYVASYPEVLKNITSLVKSGPTFDLPIKSHKVHFVMDTEEWYIVTRLYNSDEDINVLVFEKMTRMSYHEFHNDVEKMKQLLDNGVSLVVERKYGGYLFLAAAKHEQLDTRNRLFDSVTDIDEKMTIWHFDATACEDVEKIKSLIDSGANINAHDILGRTALHLAVANRNYNKIKALLEFGADVNIADNNNQNVLHYAMKHVSISKEAEYVSKLLISNDININARSVYGESPLHLAFQYHDLSVVEVLLENGADENLITLERKNMLHYAAESWCQNNITELLVKGFDKNAQDINGTSILHCACKSGRLNNIQILISSGANIHVRDNKEQTILHYAAMSPHPEEDVMKYLVETGVDIYAKDLKGRNALYVAFEHKCFKALQLLIETDKFFDSTKVPWSTLLYYSAFGGCCHGINYLNQNCENLGALDCNSDFSFNFLKFSGDLGKKLLLEMTKRVYFLIEVERNYPTFVYEPRIFLKYWERSPRYSMDWISEFIFEYLRFKCQFTKKQHLLSFVLKE